MEINEMDYDLMTYETRILSNLTKSSCTESEMSDSAGISQLMNCLENGSYDSIFQMDFAQSLLKFDSITEVYKQTLEENIKNYLGQNVDSNTLGYRQFAVMTLGRNFLQLFIQVNWTGPQITLIQGLTPKGPEWSYHEFEDDGYLYSQAKCLEYLWMAKLLLFNESLYDYPKTLPWWRLRYLKTYQALLDERSPRLFQSMCEQFEKVEKDSSFIDGLTLTLQIQFYLEAFHSFLYYYEYDNAKKYLQVAQEKAKMSVELTGALGKRTRFQQKNVAQLTLKVNRVVENEEMCMNFMGKHLPKDLSLNDDVRLDQIAFENEEHSAVQKLTSTDQLIILCVFLYHQKTNPKEKLITEELLTYLNLLLSDPKCWSTQTMALFLRSKCEREHHRTIERSMMQMQELVDQYDSSAALTKDRSYAMFSVSLPPRWIMQKELARLLLKLGATASALDIFLGLEMWEEVIGCYHSIQRRDKAEAVIRQQLAIKETPSLWCCLGDATDDPQHYLKAWEMSNHRSSRAQKALGVLHFKKKEYKECVDCLQKSVEINAIQLDTWFRLGFAAMQIENWEVAATAYRRCVNLEPDNFEAWNNLANVYIKQKLKRRAWRSIQEALRCEFEEIKLWENYLLLSTDIGEVAEAIKAYHHILDGSKKFIDAEVLGLLVKTAVGVNNTDMITKLCQLFGRITSMVVDDKLVWKHYGDLINSKEHKTPEDIEKVIRLYEKAQRYAVQQKWDATGCSWILQLSIELSNLYLGNCTIAAKVQMLNSAKMMLNNIIVKTKKFAETDGILKVDSKLLDTLQTKLEEMKKLLG